MALWNRIGKKLGEFVEDLSTDDRTLALFEKGRQAFDAGDFSSAEIHLEHATQRNDDHLRSWLLLGSAQLQRRKWLDARSSFERALVLRPDDGEILLLLARAQRQLNQLDSALLSAKKALASKLDGDALHELFTLRGEIYLDQGDGDRAVRELRKAVALIKDDDPALLGQLGLAEFSQGNAAAARQHLEAAAEDPAISLSVLMVLPEVLVALEDYGAAEVSARRLIERAVDQPWGYLWLGRAMLAQGKQSEARQQLYYALDKDRSCGPVHRVLAELQRGAQNAPAALEHLRAARAASADDVQLMVEMAELLIESYPKLSDPADRERSHRQQLLEVSEALSRQHGAEPITLAASALSVANQRNLAMQRAAESLEAEVTYFGQLVLGMLFERSGQWEGAILAFSAALTLRPTATSARERLREAYRRRQGAMSPDRDGQRLYGLFRPCQQLLTSRPSLTDLAATVGKIERDFDRPLLVAVMGEFNSGKSTFVNALLAQELVPMGITPTTATINVLKYGERESARVIWHDEREELFSWEEVGPMLRGLDNAAARAIRHVELLYPAEELQRVNVVDTPGLNSIVEEHEDTAREFLEQADAIIWLFSADQAGKQTEERALKIIAKQRLKTVAVVNKIDRLQDEQLRAVIEHLEEGFSELVELIVPVSAKRALAAQKRDDSEALGASRFPQLRQILDAEVFSRSRRIKKEVAHRKLREVLEGAAAQLHREAKPLRAAEDVLARIAVELQQDKADSLAREGRDVQTALITLFREAAAEVLDFVRPRRWVFGQHKAEQADQDFVSGLILEGLAELADDSQKRMLSAMDASAATFGEDLEKTEALVAQMPSHQPLAALWDQQRDLLQKQVYGQFQAFARGLFAGGRVERFFREELPETELSVERIEALLGGDRPLLVTELMEAQATWHRGLIEAQRRLIASWSAEIELALLRLNEAYISPLEQLTAALMRDPSS